MKVQVNFKIINPDYNQSYADHYHEGKESESNVKYTFAVSYGINDVNYVSIIENEGFVLKGKFEDQKAFELKIENVLIYRCHFENDSYEDFAVSKSILNKTHEAMKSGYDVKRFYFYINSIPASIQLSNNLIVDHRDIPKELIKE
jgi:hypothetical protein